MITTQNIDVVLDHHKYGVRPSGVVLHVAQSPQHGRIAIDLSLQRNSQQYNFIEGENKSKQFFTLLDLSRDKVIYLKICFNNNNLTHSTHDHLIICYGQTGVKHTYLNKYHLDTEQFCDACQYNYLDAAVVTRCFLNSRFF